MSKTDQSAPTQPDGTEKRSDLVKTSTDLAVFNAEIIKQDESTDTKKSHIGCAIIVLILILVGLAFVCKSCSTKAPSNSPVTPPVAVVNAEKRDPRFIQQNVGVGELNRVIGKGLSGDNADELTDSMLEHAGHSANALAIYAYSSGLWDDPNEFAKLLTKDKTYLSDEGINLWNALNGACKAKGVNRTIGKAPEDGLNSGIGKNGTFGHSDVASIRGDRTALYITFKDGSVLIVMKRCGNPVFTSKPHLPVVPTDNPKPVNPKPVKPKPVKPKLTPKDPSQDPAPRGNAPVGGGKNIDPGPGQYIPPSKMVQPPASPRVNPPKPVIKPAIPAGSKPDPTPAPAPEAGAPTPEAPATEYSPPPGG